jgi:putative transposase
MMQKRFLPKKLYHINTIDENEYSEKVWKRKAILEKYSTLSKEGVPENTIFEILEISRPTYYRWKARYRDFGLAGLEDESTAPKTPRKPLWTKKMEQQVLQMRRKYPLFGKAKIRVMIEKELNEKISVSTVGRIISNQLHKGSIKPVCFLVGRKMTKNRKFNGHAERWKLGMKANKVGELIEFDHMTINNSLKHFNAICPITKIAVQRVYRAATCKNASDFLEFALKGFPFKVLSIQVDGGSEFMGEFEKACQRRNIKLYVLPPRSPEYNAHVERSNGTFKYEFYSQCSNLKDIEVVQTKLQNFVQFYNKIRPHQGLSYLTPVDYFESIKTEALQSHML